MEKNIEMNIKRKILLRTSFVIIIIYVFSGVFAYNYFSNIFKQRAITDDKIKLHQIEQQLQYVYEDITRFSQNIIIDQSIQAFLKGDNGENLSLRSNIATRLGTLIALRTYVHSAILISNNGVILYNAMPFNKEYIREKLKEEWYKNYNKENRYYFSNPHYLGGPDNSSDVISYIVDIRDINNPSESIGKLVLNVNLSYLQKFIESSIGEFDDFLWLSQDNGVIFKKVSDKNFFELFPIIDELAQKKEEIRIEFQEENGYVLADRSAENGWKFISYTSKERVLRVVKNIAYFFVASTLLSLVLIIMVILPIVSNITKPITRLTNVMKKVSKGDFDVNIQINSGDEIEILGDGFNSMISSLKEHIDKIVKYEKDKKEMEFDLLVSQINPHFVYNVLNTAVYMARKQKNNDIAELINSFIKLLQDSLDISSKELFATLAHEMNIVTNYLKIQCYRYPNRFDVYCKFDNDLHECIVPKTIIQPIVENALFHGICSTDIKGKIEIWAVRNKDDLNLIIQDNGIGMSEEKIHELMYGNCSAKSSSGIRHIGIINIRERISFLYGAAYGIEIESIVDKGTKVTIKIPINKAKT